MWADERFSPAQSSSAAWFSIKFKTVSRIQFKLLFTVATVNLVDFHHRIGLNFRIWTTKKLLYDCEKSLWCLFNCCLLLLQQLRYDYCTHFRLPQMNEIKLNKFMMLDFAKLFTDRSTQSRNVERVENRSFLPSPNALFIHAICNFVCSKIFM